MEIEIFNAVLVGDIYDGNNWVKSHTSLSKKDILDWVNTSIDTLASEWGVNKISHKYGEIIDGKADYSVFKTVSERDITSSDDTMRNQDLILEDNNTNRVFCLLTRSVVDLSKNVYNGHEFVDLGLPSGTLWATCNVGATSPEQAGLYFAWGETTGYTDEQVKKGERVFDKISYKASGISADLTLEQDAARANLGGEWRMPTKDEWQELIDNCDDAWTENYNGTGVSGYIFTSKVNGNSVFFPAAGACYGSSVEETGQDGFYSSTSRYSSLYAWGLGFHYEYRGLCFNYLRYSGKSVRGVWKSK